MGGTDFNQAFAAAEDIIILTPEDYISIIILLTDGEGKKHKVLDYISRMKKSYPNL